MGDLRHYDFAKDRDIEIFSPWRRFWAVVIVGLCLIGFVTVLVAGLWVGARMIWP
jgi:hypothetical protein